MDWVQKRFSREEIMQNNRRKKMKKETKKYGTILRIFQRTKFLEELK